MTEQNRPDLTLATDTDTLTPDGETVRVMNFPTSFWGQLLPLDLPSPPQREGHSLILTAPKERIFLAGTPLPLYWNAWEDMAQVGAQEVLVGLIEDVKIGENGEARCLFFSGRLLDVEELPLSFLELWAGIWRARSYACGLPVTVDIRPDETLTAAPGQDQEIDAFTLGKVRISPKALWDESVLMPCAPGGGFSSADPNLVLTPIRPRPEPAGD